LLSVHIAVLDGGSADFLFFLFLIFVVLALVSAGWDPEAGLTVVERSILAGKVDALSVALDIVAAALRKSASTSGEFGGDSSVGGDPVSESIFAVLDDGLGCLVSIISSAGLTWGNRCVVDKFQKVLSVTSNDGELLAVLPESIELVSVSSLELLTGNIGELCLSDKRLGLSTNKLLFEDNDLRRVWLLVLELSNLVGDLLLAY
jgi:hypothetical protein